MFISDKVQMETEILNEKSMSIGSFYILCRDCEAICFKEKQRIAGSLKKGSVLKLRSADSEGIHFSELLLLYENNPFTSFRLQTSAEEYMLRVSDDEAHLNDCNEELYTLFKNYRTREIALHDQMKPLNAEIFQPGNLDKLQDLQSQLTALHSDLDREYAALIERITNGN